MTLKDSNRPPPLDSAAAPHVAVPRVGAGSDPLIGRVINERYRIMSSLARGGMGTVYRANQSPLGRLVALKVLDPNYKGDNDPEFHKRFFLEASTASKLTHPNTVTIFDYGKTDDDIFYIAMELLEGRTLHRALRDEGPFSPERAMHIARQICRSLREAHGLNVIHRDLKPANVYLVAHGDETDFVKVLDFGLVKNVDDKGEELTHTGVFMGSPKYMSPEQIRGEKVDGRVDIYALGVIMFEMLTGKVPYDRPNSVNILMAHISEPIPPMSAMNPDVHVPPELEDVIRICLAKSPDERFSSMNELLIALTHLGGGRSSGTASGEFRVTRSTEISTISAGSFTATEVRRPELMGDAALKEASATPPGDATWTAPFAQVQKPSSGILPLILAGLFALTGVGGFLFLGGAFDDQVAADAEEPPTKPAEPAVKAVEAAPQAPQPLSKVVLTLRSVPEGATVLVGDKKYGPTPTHVVWSGGDATLGRELTFRFQKKGYRDATITQTITGERMEVTAPALELATARKPGP
jgi:eukaryotic-like serine/threonine-protein kinase